MEHRICLEGVCARARAWRRSRGYTLEQIAEISGYSTSVVSQFERGQNNNALLLIIYIKLGFKEVVV